ncbi:SigE family RNA polymerase sigma factor [Nocardioides sp. GY 10113]|uniref:SigE family RNA polymerase sigma factor n=1 Tax=Nocardioides sp. GY 10113 TaxID=2569761 RepID=UPI0010A90168|nr:SigE family RNA polymerase sigma factor [Nocardioides sp. GY 10113]TIC87452.1 SigE family RNA polymerase sigma factor [Nocardioides sp. GY 10113]
MATKPEFDDFVVARSPALLRTAYLLTGDAALAEDLLQTALVKAWSAWSRVHDDPEPYVRRILATTRSSWWRRRRDHEMPVDLSTATGEATPEGTDPAEREDLWQALRHLPPRQRAVVVLRYYEDLTEAQTADVLDCSIGTVKSQHAKALARLRLDPAVQPAVNDGSAP